MSRTLTVSDAVYDHLSALARQSGLSSVEEWLEQQKGQSTSIRKDALDRIARLREELSERYGEMPDSTPLIAEDRMR